MAEPRDAAWDRMWERRWRRHEPSGSARRFRLTVGDVQATGYLLEEAAPQTCAAFWAALPLEGRLIHSMWSGEMVRLYEPLELANAIGTENLLAHGFPGHLTYDPPERELAFAYGLCHFKTPAGLKPLTVFARITDNLEPIARQMAATRLSGLALVRIEWAA